MFHNKSQCHRQPPSILASCSHRDVRTEFSTMKCLCHGGMEGNGAWGTFSWLLIALSVRQFDNLAACHFSRREQTGDERQEGKVLRASLSFPLYCKAPVSKRKPCFTGSNLAVDFLLSFSCSSEQNPQLRKQNSAATAELSVKAQSLTNVIFLSPGLRTGGCAAAEPWQPSGGEWQFDTALSPSRRLLHLTQALGPVLGTR